MILSGGLDGYVQAIRGQNPLIYGFRWSEGRNYFLTFSMSKDPNGVAHIGIIGL